MMSLVEKKLLLRGQFLWVLIEATTEVAYYGLTKSDIHESGGQEVAIDRGGLVWSDQV